MQDRFKFRIPTFTDKGTFQEFQYIELGEQIECTLCGYNGKPQQCTGLKDKNGKLIFEGDILKVTYCNTKSYDIFYVLHNDKTCCFAYTDGIAYDELCLSDCQRLEVIGNTYENPQLLEDK